MYYQIITLDHPSHTGIFAYRTHMTRLRLSSHPLEIEQGRFNNTNIENRICKICNQNVLESEFHFHLVCSKYSSLRSKYLGNVTCPSMQTFIAIMSSTNKKKLYNLAKYIKEAMSIRTNILHDISVS